MAIPKLSEIEWAQIRSSYEGENPNVSALAKRYGISRSLLQKRASAEGWSKGEVRRPEAGDDPAVAPSPEGDATEEEGATGFDGALQARVLLGQQREWRRLDRLFREALRPLDPSWTPDGKPHCDKEGNKVPLPLHVRLKYAEQHAAHLQKMVGVLAAKQPREREAYRIDLRKPGGPDQGEATEEAKAKGRDLMKRMIDTAIENKHLRAALAEAQAAGHALRNAHGLELRLLPEERILRVAAEHAR